MIEIFALNGKAERVDKKIASIKKGKRVWINLVKPLKEEIEELKPLNIHPTTQEDLRKPHQRPKIDEFDNYLYIVIYGLDKKFKRIQLGFLIGNNFLITTAPGEYESFKELQEDKEKLTKFLIKGPDFLLHHFIDKIVDNYFPVLDGIDEEIERLEKELFEKQERALVNRLFDLRKEIIQIRKVIAPQRDRIGFLARMDTPFISKEATLYFRDVYDHMVRVTDAIENYRELITSTQEAYLTIVSNKLNEVMKVLTVIATIILPLTLVVGWYGMNFSYMPELEWQYGYPMVMGLSFLIFFGMVFYFKKKGWV